MTTIYRVEYSETHGYYVSQIAVQASGYGYWRSHAAPDEDTEPTVFKHSDGWRASEVEAVDQWRQECQESAAAIRVIAVELENIAQGPSPVIPQNRIMKPEMK
jgi:hypothetical protein